MRQLLLFLLSTTLFTISACEATSDSDSVDTWTVTFDSTGADIPAEPGSLTVIEPAQTIAELPEPPVKSGSTFDGWWTASEGGTAFTAATPVTEDITVYAHWTAAAGYQISFNGNGAAVTGTMAAITAAAGTSVTLPACTFSNPGYAFAGWALTAGGTVVYADCAVTAALNANVALYAVWTPLAGHTITYVKNDSRAAGTMTVQFIPEGSGATLAACAYSIPGLQFQGWAFSANDSVALTDGAAIPPITADLVLYAKWGWKDYALRDTGPAGGLIFYINPNAATDGWKYLEAAPADTEWDEPKWGAYEHTTGGNGTAPGTAKNNTALAVTKLAALGETNCAAQLADALVCNGFTDWFLPSKDELDAMYDELQMHSVGGFPVPVGSAAYFYWSSSEGGQYTVWNQNFNGGMPNLTVKNVAAGRRARAIRSF